MIKNPLLLSCTALFALGATNCGTSAFNFRPSEVVGGQAAIFGRVKVVNEGEPLTEDCTITFLNEDTQDETTMELDNRGWVFTTVAPGPTYLSSIDCRLAGTPTGKVDYSTRSLAFQATGSGRIVYFGHIWIDMQTATLSKGDRFAASVAKGFFPTLTSGYSQEELARRYAMSAEPGKAPSTAPPMPNADVFAADVQNNFDAAVVEYQRRYDGDAHLLKPEVSIAGASADAIGVLGAGAPPTLALGFALGGDRADAEARCARAGLTLQHLDDGAASCNGAALDGVPMNLKLTFCAGAICEVTADAGADGAPWSTLLQRFGKLTRRLAQNHGDKHQRKTRPLAGCALSAGDCVVSGRVFKSATWRWPNKQQVALVLDGGPPAGAPSLRVVYRTGALVEGKP
jgi:hypothetical protein